MPEGPDLTVGQRGHENGTVRGQRHHRRLHRQGLVYGAGVQANRDHLLYGPYVDSASGHDHGGAAVHGAPPDHRTAWIAASGAHRRAIQRQQLSIVQQ